MNKITAISNITNAAKKNAIAPPSEIITTLIGASKPLIRNTSNRAIMILPRNYLKLPYIIPSHILVTTMLV
ncbi:MAG: hypothetical protein J6R96_00815, partial [Spirochaetaceae bacterium]|nr:hypothetical protein [Spirochaetaceae bacterium]